MLTIIIYPRLDAILQFVDGFENLTAACTLEVVTMCYVSCHCNTVYHLCQGWKCLMSSVDILEAVDPLSHNLQESDPAVLQLQGARWVDTGQLDTQWTLS